MSLSAVKTTGIYCQPGCSASPNPSNVVAYDNAAAAEADGFRACLRCRPYRSHHSQPSMQGPELVCRGIRLIVDGALNDQLEADLAQRLAVSPRHLRRLFLDHVGATPDQVARSGRAHFARRLLDDTDLPVTDVAFAAGFGSVRQMSRVMNEVFHASPTTLRAKRRQSDRLIADGGLVSRLTFNPPLSWEGLLSFVGARAIPGVESVSDSTYRRTIDVDGLSGAVEVWRDGDHLITRFHLPRWEGLIHHVARVRRLFDLDHEPAAPSADLSDDPALAPWTAGLRVPGSWDPFETGVRAIVGQQVSVAGATATMGKIAHAYGKPTAGLDAFGLDVRFPEPEALVEADLPIPRQRATAVRAFAAAVVDGRLAVDGSLPLARFAEQLGELPGVGSWTAQYLALRLGYADAFPASDLGVIKALGTATPTETTERAERWRPWRAYATVRLWSH